MDPRITLQILIRRLEPEIKGLPPRRVDPLAEAADGSQGRLHFLEAVTEARAALDSGDSDRIAKAAVWCQAFERKGAQLKRGHQDKLRIAREAVDRERSVTERDLKILLKDAEHVVSSEDAKAGLRAGGQITGAKRSAKAKQLWAPLQSKFENKKRPGMGRRELTRLRADIVGEAIEAGVLPPEVKERTIRDHLPIAPYQKTARS